MLIHRSRGLILSALLVPVLAGSAHAETVGAMKIDPIALDNAYVRVSRDSTLCAKAAAGTCEDRLILSMGPLVLVADGRRRRMKRGDAAVFTATQSYEPPTLSGKDGGYYEIAINPSHPPFKAPAERIDAANNKPVHDAKTFFIYEEQLRVGVTRERHSHGQRVEIRLNNGPMLHQWVWKDGAAAESEPSIVNWR
jgi:hypothetical protein